MFFKEKYMFFPLKIKWNCWKFVLLDSFRSLLSNINIFTVKLMLIIVHWSHNYLNPLWKSFISYWDKQIKSLETFDQGH